MLRKVRITETRILLDAGYFKRDFATGIAWQYRWCRGREVDRTYGGSVRVAGSGVMFFQPGPCNKQRRASAQSSFPALRGQLAEDRSPAARGLRDTGILGSLCDWDSAFERHFREVSVPFSRLGPPMRPQLVSVRPVQ
jgi:hypothetical protein